MVNYWKNKHIGKQTLLQISTTVSNLAIATLVSSITTTKGQDFYVVLFRFVSFPWSRSPKRK